MSNRLRGIDISHYQPTPDPNALNSSGLAFCWVKATQGNQYKYSSFVTQYDAVSKSALLRGAYHFFDPSVDGTTQAKFFSDMVLQSFTAGDLPPMIDVEMALNGTSAADAIANLKACIAQMKTDFGLQPVIYTNFYYWRDTLGNPKGFSASPLWLAAYSANPPNVPGDWGNMTIWQYRSDYPATFYNPTLDIDADYFYGSISDLWNLAGLNSIGPTHSVQPKVFALQTALTNAGYNTHGVDGFFGDNTKAALTNWQGANGFNQDGIITPDQWAKLFGISYV